MCNRRCFICKYPDCICDEPLSLREAAIIEADSRQVAYMQLPRYEREKLKERREKDRLYRSQRREQNHAYNQANIERIKAQTREWRKRRREGYQEEG